MGPIGVAGINGANGGKQELSGANGCWQELGEADGGYGGSRNQPQLMRVMMELSQYYGYWVGLSELIDIKGGGQQE